MPATFIIAKNSVFITYTEPWMDSEKFENIIKAKLPENSLKRYNHPEGLRWAFERRYFDLVRTAAEGYFKRVVFEWFDASKQLLYRIDLYDRQYFSFQYAAENLEAQGWVDSIPTTSGSKKDPVQDVFIYHNLYDSPYHKYALRKKDFESCIGLVESLTGNQVDKPAETVAETPKIRVEVSKSVTKTADPVTKCTIYDTGGDWFDISFVSNLAFNAAIGELTRCHTYFRDWDRGTDTVRLGVHMDHFSAVVALAGKYFSELEILESAPPVPKPVVVKAPEPVPVVVRMIEDSGRDVTGEQIGLFVEDYWGDLHAPKSA